MMHVHPTLQLRAHSQRHKALLGEAEQARLARLARTQPQPRQTIIRAALTRAAALFL